MKCHVCLQGGTARSFKTRRLLFRFSVIETIAYTFTTISRHFLLYWEETAELRVDLMMIIDALQKGG